ncbi:Long-chain-fatty-acid--CoA ligase [Saccharolobus shibatae B12]|uniref:Long-chain-fatty-acid--CoA ligase n=1 Tax=Saccharolobus shibatae (strain ATCC 51178 / DSM 5389 / JCM 8931 / NBRC 15437 / B12) TaxID=523848 RepID=A0A8F5GS63_SACSH|nr:AMP-binding protein [Saccharolobus shibatae]QXJ27553.1 Long-chain-fatty-acid--CoA ligase [Saccharolobus shibatae B12]
MIASGEKKSWEPKTQVEVLEESVNEFKDKVAIDYFGTKVTFEQLGIMVNSVASQLSEYVKKGDVVILSTQNVPQFIIVEYAIWKLGGIVLPINPSYTENELRYLISDSNTKIAIASCESKLKNLIQTITTNPNTFHEIPSEYREKWRIIDDCEEELNLKSSKRIYSDASPGVNDLALLVYTSGTTGRPKGVPITHSNIYASSYIYREWFRFNENDRVLGIAPFFHITGQIFHITTSILSGSSIHTSFRFDSDLSLGTVEESKTTLTMAVATAYMAMLNALDKQDLSSMRLWSSGGMAMPKAIEEEWRKRVGDWIYMAWGLTETTSPATLWPYPYDGNLPVEQEYGIVSSGVPVYNTEVMIGEDGEILVRGPQVVKGYWKIGEFKDGWLPTGDIGKIVNGWVYIIDRKKDIINASGFKVMPREVEEVLYQHYAVDEAVVVGVPDEYRGENVVAYVKLKREYSPSEALAEDIIKYCRLHLASYKVPRQIRFVNDIPKTPSGKIMRRAFRGEM